MAPPRPEYVDDALRWLSDPQVTRFMGVRNPPTRQWEIEFFDRMGGSNNDVFWSILLGERHIGGIGIHGIDWRNRTAITGIMIGERDCWGQGYATEAMHLRTSYAFDELGLETLTTQVNAANDASRRALLRAGYRQAGVLRRHFYAEGDFRDVWLGEILRTEWQATTGAD
jgi:RimJ/RimL family protein N-acetyltransferase